MSAGPGGYWECLPGPAALKLRVRRPFGFRDGMIFRPVHWEWQVSAWRRSCTPRLGEQADRSLPNATLGHRGRRPEERQGVTSEERIQRKVGQEVHSAPGSARGFYRFCARRLDHWSAIEMSRCLAAHFDGVADIHC